MITFKNEAEVMEFIEAYMASLLNVRQFCLSLVAPEPWKPERGDRVKTLHGVDECDVVEIQPDGSPLVQYDDGSLGKFVSTKSFTLVTPASKREIEVGDTFICSNCGGNEYVAKPVNPDDYDIMDARGNKHRKDTCTFRSRPHKPEPTLLERVEKLEKRVSGIENKEDGIEPF